MKRLLPAALVLLCPAALMAAGGSISPEEVVFPPALESYRDSGNLWQVLVGRAKAEPLNVVATAIFLLAILHTFLAPRFMHLSHMWRDAHRKKLQAQRQVATENDLPPVPEAVSFKAEVMHFFGEIEAVFGIWVVPLLAVLAFAKGWPATEAYIKHAVHFTEPMFVVVIMSIAATRPVLRFAEVCLQQIARLGKETPAAWWLAILSVGPVLGSFITEPAAMTICALLLSRQIYDRKPSSKLAYATMGLLFVNVSIGGTLTHFAAPPVLMVAQKWKWDMAFMFGHFGWRSVVAILASNGVYYMAFRKELHEMAGRPSVDEGGPNTWEDRTDAVPVWVTIVHLFFLGWTVFTAHVPALFVGGFLFFLAFTTATEHHQNRIQLAPALLVGFFLAGLVIHGGLQGWWIAPVLAALGELPLMFAATGLTAFNDNAAITYLATLVPEFSDGLKYAVVSGAVAGGGLTVIANAPNPAGQSILSEYFPDGVSPVRLLTAALLPTAIAMVVFVATR